MDSFNLFENFGEYFQEAAQAMVTSLLAIKLLVTSSLVSNYVLVADSNKNLHVLQNGTVVRSLEMPSIVNTMCAGYFLEGLDVSTPLSPQSVVPPRSASPQQVALGLEDGRIIILHNFNLKLYANVKLTLTKMVTCSLGKGTDALLCCGHFNSMLIYHNGILMRKIATNDWVNSIEVMPSWGKHEHCVYLGTLDGTIQTYGISMLSK